MRRLLFSLLMFCVLPAWADGHDQLYKVAGWPDQRAHFNDALSAAQQRYQNNLPPAVFQALVNNSNQRFAPRPWISAPKRSCASTLPIHNRR
jgi:hypothetical protein